jgi:hypothetical protein
VASALREAAAATKAAAQQAAREAAHPKGDPLAFYTVAATIIPVLFLAVAYEAKVLELVPPKIRFFLAQSVGILAFGAEAVALRVLVHGKPSMRVTHFVSVVILILAIAILTQPMLASLDKDAEARRQEKEALEKAAERTRERLDARKEQLGIEMEELQELQRTLIAGARTPDDVKKRIAELRDITAKQRADTEEDERNANEYERIANSLRRRIDAAGVPLPPWAVVGLAVFGVAYGSLLIYGVF